MQRVYMDHAATAPLRPEVREAMLPWLTGEGYGNASSIYRLGRQARHALDEAREGVAAHLGAQAAEVFFTSGGSEANNLALKGVAWALRERGNHIVASRIEHHSVLHALEFLETQGFDVTYVPVDEGGLVAPAEVAAALTGRTILISLMHANNEIGTIQPVRDVAALARKRGIVFHVDAVQTVGTLPVRVAELGCDLLSLSAHKFGGPKGVGALYVRKGTPIVPLVHGGGQERSLRGGTENVAGIVGLARALALAQEGQMERADRVRGLRDALIEGVLGRIEGVRLNGHRTQRLPGNANFSLAGVSGESLLLNLDMRGIAASSGSACTSGSLEPSHVLLALGLPRSLVLGSLRLTLGPGNTRAEVDHVVETLAEVVEKLRRTAPVYEEL